MYVLYSTLHSRCGHDLTYTQSRVGTLRYTIVSGLCRLERCVRSSLALSGRRERKEQQNVCLLRVPTIGIGFKGGSYRVGTIGGSTEYCALSYHRRP